MIKEFDYLNFKKKMEKQFYNPNIAYSFIVTKKDKDVVLEVVILFLNENLPLENKLASEITA